MPYIVKDRRKELNSVHKDFPKTAGELNWLITDIVLTYLKQKEKVGYAEINEVMGVYECSKLEFYRRAAAPYEDTKIKENGDVY